MATMALFSSSLHSFIPRPHLPTSRRLTAAPVAKRGAFFRTQIRASENGAGPAGGAAAAAAVVEEKLPEKEEAVSQVEVASSTPPPVVVEPKVVAVESVNGAAGAMEAPVFKDTRWVGGTWDLAQFEKDGKTDWDAVIDAEVRRRKWLEVNPESTTNEEPVVFDTSIIPWWAWMKRFHLPEAELLNGRAAMIGFFMAYFVDSLTGIGLVDQMGNFFCKTLLFIAVVGVLLFRKSEDIEKLKKLIEETTLYDKQWQATWQDEPPRDKSKD